MLEVPLWNELPSLTISISNYQAVRTCQGEESYTKPSTGVRSQHCLEYPDIRLEDGDEKERISISAISTWHSFINCGFLMPISIFIYFYVTFSPLFFTVVESKEILCKNTKLNSAASFHSYYWSFMVSLVNTQIITNTDVFQSCKEFRYILAYTKYYMHKIFKLRVQKIILFYRFFPLLLLSLAFYYVFLRTTSKEMFCTFQYSSSNCERKHTEICLKGGLKLLLKLLFFSKNTTKWNKKCVN